VLPLARLRLHPAVGLDHTAGDSSLVSVDRTCDCRLIRCSCRLIWVLMYTHTYTHACAQAQCGIVIYTHSRMISDKTSRRFIVAVISPLSLGLYILS